ncbi:MAG: histidine phosphatase family protein, partial [Solobacterium sp.]|nr:histidine phosphatase family protein [Solobacterium sp.]
TAVYTSPLQRCLVTAKAVSKASGLPSPVVLEDLRELDAGAWDGLTFREIRERYPQEYERRGRDPANVPPPGGESFAEAGRRFSLCMNRLLSESRGDIAVIAHAGVIRAFCCMVTGMDMNDLFSLPQPYGGISLLQCTGEGLYAKSIGFRPEGFFGSDEIHDLYRRFNTPEHIQAHMKAVADYVEQLLPALSGTYDRARLIHAALVHDAARTQVHHADAAADALEKAGFTTIAALVRDHHSPIPDESPFLTEAELLFYADKRLAGTDRVSVDERFARSLYKCRTPEAREYHRRMHEKALLIEQKIKNAAAGKEDFL